MKLLLTDPCSQILGGHVRQYIENLRSVAIKAPKLCIRIHCCRGWTDTQENMSRIVEAIQINQIHDIELLEVHKLGMKKIRSLGMKEREIPINIGESVETVAQALSSEGILFSNDNV